MILPADLLEWIEETTEGKILDVRRQAHYRASYYLTVQLSTETRAFYLRYERSTLNGINQFYPIAREAMIQSTLFEHGIPVAEVLGHNRQHDAVLMACLEGIADVHAPDNAQRTEQLMRDYIRIIADVHAIDADHFAIDTGIPDTAQAIALDDLNLWFDLYRSTAETLDPAIVFAVDWLQRNVPKPPSKVALLQGDTGPGQFLFTDQGITGIVDWELAHFGDPIEDLASIRMRTLLIPCGDLKTLFQHYAECANLTIDIEKLRYYTVRTMLNAPLSLLGTELRHLDPSADSIANLGWATLFKRGACEALAEANGVALEEPTVAWAETEAQKYYAVLQHNLQNEHLASIEDDFAQHRLRGAIALVSYLRAWNAMADDIQQQECEELSALLGQSVRSLSTGSQTLTDQIERGERVGCTDTIKYIYRRCRREELVLTDALKIIGMQAGIPLTPIH